MSNGYQTYRRASQASWTRVEMLLAIYDATLTSIATGIEALNTHDEETHTAQQLRATKLLLLILEGIDPNDETAGRIRDLCLFCLNQVAISSASAWISAQEVLTILRDGFEGIREEAVQLEASGEIPRLDQSPEQTLMHL